MNPGGVATYGFVVYRDGKKVSEGFGVAGLRDTSNNVAEYSAAVEALKWLLGSGLRDELVVLKSDSELLVNQLSGLYAVRARRVRPLHEKVRQLLAEYRSAGGEVGFEWIPREENGEADGLSRRAYEEFCSRNPDVLRQYAGHLEKRKARRGGVAWKS